MSKILILSFFAVSLIVSGCKTDKIDRPHQGCHKVGVHRAGRNGGSTHHHYAKPDASADEKKR